MKSTISYGYPYASAGIETALPVIENKSTPKRPIGFVTHEDKKDAPKGINKAVKVGRGKKAT